MLHTHMVLFFQNLDSALPFDPPQPIKTTTMSGNIKADGSITATGHGQVRILTIITKNAQFCKLKNVPGMPYALTVLPCIRHGAR